MEEQWELLREAPLTNNCPECYNQDLSLRFRQKHLIGRFFHRVTGEIREELDCNTCHSTIYPVQWTQDIEGSVTYYRKMVAPRRPAFRFKALFYVIMLLGIVLVAAVVYFWLSGAIRM